MYVNKEHELEMLRWRKENGEDKRVDYNLTPDSIVFNVGGYNGDWGLKIAEKFNCNIYAFEPVKQFFNKYTERNTSSKLKLYNFGLSNEDRQMSISVSNDSSSVYREFAQKEVITLKKASKFILENKISKIDLMQINIEGEEYNVLHDLIDSGVINTIENLQIQFHHIPSKYEESQKKEVISKLEISHNLKWKYAEWIWERWEKKT